MEQIPAQVQNKIKILRKNGLTHRQIARLLHVGHGTAAHYSRGIDLTPSQKALVNKNNYKKSLGKLTKEERLEASRKGGVNTLSHFPIKHSRKQLLKTLQDFYVKEGRLPTKRDFVGLYSAVLRVFQTWNKAIKTAGFSPNPVLFSKKYTANDGHRCDSLSEKIIDDWLKARHVLHERHVSYFGTKYTADFKVKNTYIEFFGLHGELKSYDILMRKKINLIHHNKAKLIAIYPADIFPQSKLDIILGNLV